MTGPSAIAGVHAAPNPAKEKGFDNVPNPLMLLVGREGFEPSTNGLRVRCSTS